MSDTRELTDRVINMFPLRWTSRDVREGLCTLGECHKPVPGSFYEPQEIFALVESGQFGLVGGLPLPGNGDFETYELLREMSEKCWLARYGRE